MLCTCLDKKAAELKRLLDETAATSMATQPTSTLPSLQAASALLAEPSAAAALKLFTRALSAATDLCSRTSAIYCSDAKSQQFWFSVLAWIVALQREACHPDSDAGSTRRISFAADVSAAALRMTMSEALQSVVETMRHFIPLNVVLKKVLADHSQSLLGEFRGVILAMLGSHAHDARVLASAGAIMKADLFTSVRRLHTGFASAVNACNGGGGNGSTTLMPGSDAGGVACASCGVMLLSGDSDVSRNLKVAAATSSAGGRAAQADGGGAHRVTVYGCGHSYHVSCVAQHAGALRPTCPLCAKTADAKTPVRVKSGVAAGHSRSRPIGSAPPNPGSGASASSLDLQGPHPTQAAVEASDDGDALAARVGAGARRQTHGGGRGQELGRDNMVPASRATADAVAGDVGDGDPHITRLRQARAARAGRRPLTEQFSEFRRSPEALQVRLRL